MEKLETSPLPPYDGAPLGCGVVFAGAYEPDEQSCRQKPIGLLSPSDVLRLRRLRDRLPMKSLMPFWFSRPVCQAHLTLAEEMLNQPEAFGAQPE